MGQGNLIAMFYPPVEPTTFLKSKRYHLFHWYFIASYYTLFIPFKPVEQLGRLTLKTSKIQKVLCLCGFWPLLCIYFSLEIIRRFYAFINSEGYHAALYFRLFYYSLKVINQLIIFWTVTTKQMEIEILFNKIRTSTLLPLTPNRKKEKVVTTYIFFMLIIAFLIVVLNCDIFDGNYESIISPTRQLENAIKSGRKRLFLAKAKQDDYYSQINLAIAGIEWVLQLVRLWDNYCTLVFLAGILPFTFWSATNGFQTVIIEISRLFTQRFPPSQKYHLQKVIIEKYDELHELTNCINSISSTLTIVWVVETTFHMVVRLNEAVKSKNLLVAYVVFGTIFLVMALLLMAEGWRHVACFKEWLTTKQARDIVFKDKSELERLERSLEVCQVGIGSTGFFQINYAFITHLVIFTVTIFLISFDDSKFHSH